MKPSSDVTIVDYGMGNLSSVSKAVEKLGFRPLISSRPQDVEKAARLILPGVGAFSKAMAELRKRKLVHALRDYLQSGRPFLGICLGLQLLFEESEEGSRVKGLGIFPGRVVRFRKAPKVPHMGWNQIRYAQAGASKKCPLLKNVREDDYFYFVHSYFPQPQEKKLACLTTRYGENFTSMIWRDNIFASQFHPEKSQAVGLAFLDSFLNTQAA